VNEAMAGESAAEIARATRIALRDAAFLYHLVLTLNVTAEEVTKLAFLRSVILVREIGPLMGQPLSEDVEARKVDPEGARRIDADWQSWRECVEALVGEVQAERIARSSLDDGYYDGQSVLLPEASDAWTELTEQADRLEQMVEQLREPFRTRAGIPTEWVMTGPPEEIASRVRARARELTDAARIAAFTFLGEDERAMAIAERRLRG
jgi:hypothetical protein